MKTHQEFVDFLRSEGSLDNSIFIHYVNIMGDSKYRDRVQERIEKLTNDSSLGYHWVVPTIPIVAMPYGTFSFLETNQDEISIDDDYSIVHVSIQSEKPWDERSTVLIRIPKATSSFYWLRIGRVPANMEICVYATEVASSVDFLFSPGLKVDALVLAGDLKPGV